MALRVLSRATGESCLALPRRVRHRHVWASPRLPTLSSGGAVSSQSNGTLVHGPACLRTSCRGVADILAARTLAACGVRASDIDVRKERKAIPSKAAKIAPGTPYSKELRLLTHVLENATAGDPASVCHAIEHFGKSVLNPGGQWLKVAGDAKAVVLTSAMQGMNRKGVILEIGCYCGFSAIRMSMAMPGVRIVTLEVDPAHVVIARNMVAFAGLAHNIDVWTGHSKDLLSRLPDRYGGVQKFRVGGIFMDQRGSRYDEDLAKLESLGVLLPGCVVVADNVLKPGSPLFLWRLRNGGTYDSRFITLQEFAMTAEDWMSVSVRRADAPTYEDATLAEKDPVGAEAPAELTQLQWEADRMRAQATRIPGVTFQEWSNFADHMKEGMGRYGLKADFEASELDEKPWLALGDHGQPPKPVTPEEAEEAARIAARRRKVRLPAAWCNGC